MTDFDYAARQLAGVWKMAWNRPDWRETLDRSVNGVFLSFWAAAFAAPLAFLGYFSMRRAAGRMTDFPETTLMDSPAWYALAAEMVGYATDWAVSLITLLFAARTLKAEKRVGDVVIGFNWLQVFIAASQAAPLALLGLTGSAEFAGLIFIPATVLIIALFWGYLRRSLEAGPGAVIALILLLTLIGIVVNSVVSAAAAGFYRLFS